MRDAWDDFAERDAMFYIQCERTDWTPEEFFADGRSHFGAVLNWVGDRVQRGAMLDLGCGLGRLTVAAAPHFESVV
jgi:tRNA/tmRNA/rRNA uracil-C5-methylase (TrmA/RlmC/RlmD family)